MRLPKMNDTQLCNNHYVLLARLLSPWQNEEIIEHLIKLLQNNKIKWERVLYMANLHYCAPLWFSSLKKNGLLPSLPPDLQIYLEHLHQANLERQEYFHQALKEILVKTHDKGVPIIALKGAATFCDDLYNDKGARMMGDIDLLVKSQHIKLIKKILRQLGYEEQADCFGKPIGLLSRQAHHLPRYLKPGTPVAVEIHFQTAHQGQADRVLTTEMSWANKELKTWEGLYPFILMPTYRLLHNTVHTLLPNRAYTSSIFPLNQLVEFAYIVHRYHSSIDWRKWLMKGTYQGLNRPFRIYLTLAHRLMGVPIPKQVSPVSFSNLHMARIYNAAKNKADSLSGNEKTNYTTIRRVKDVGIRIYTYVYFRVTRIAWEWNNLCYKNGLRNIPFRLFCSVRLISNRINLRKSYEKNIKLYKGFKRRFFQKNDL